MQSQNNNNNTNTTNQQNNTTEERTTHITSPPITRASPVSREQTTAEIGLPRRRIKWTQDMNMSVLKAYFRATRGENPIGYRQQMYTYFLSEYPELSHLTQQNIADRRAAIIRNNLIPTAIQEEIRRNVEHELKHNSTTPILQNTTETIVTEIGQNTLNNIPESQETIHITPPTQSTEQITDITSSTIAAFNESKIKFSEISPENRPYIPKPTASKLLTKITSIVNNHILPQEIAGQEITYNQLIELIYCSANTVTTLTEQINKSNTAKRNSPTNRHNRRNTNKFSNATSKQQTTQNPRWQSRIEGKINEYRRDLGVITSHINGKTGKRCKNKLNNIKRKYTIHTQFDPANNSIEQKSS
ncbi:uncharacterized protein [Musca autumnalis]|uniref:uncharacterized protein n=1 Tax=Musca autumnalis TaxID=221902 RepID=UPI003CF4546D